MFKLDYSNFSNLFRNISFQNSLLLAFYLFIFKNWNKNESLPNFQKQKTVVTIRHSRDNIQQFIIEWTIHFILTYLFLKINRIYTINQIKTIS